MDSSRERRLVMAGLAFAFGSAIHLIDHLRRGQGSVSDVLYAAGNVTLVVQVATIALVLTRHRLAPLSPLYPPGSRWHSVSLQHIGFRDGARSATRFGKSTRSPGSHT